MRRSFAFVLASVATPALAHSGHHEALTLAEQARHVIAQPDHWLALSALAAFAAGGGLALRRARARIRK